jgi:hypothetical protein
MLAVSFIFTLSTIGRRASFAETFTPFTIAWDEVNIAFAGLEASIERVRYGVSPFLT